MTPERVKEIARQAARDTSYSGGTVFIEDAIRQAVNEALEEVVTLIKRNASSAATNPRTLGEVAAIEQAVRNVRALKLPEGR